MMLWWFACQDLTEQLESPLLLPVVQARHMALQEKWNIESVSGDVQGLASAGRWGEAGVLAEQQFLLEPSWAHLSLWILNDAFSPYPDQWSKEEHTEILPHLSPEIQHIVGGLSALEREEAAAPLDGNTLWAWWYTFRYAHHLQDAEQQKEAAIQLRTFAPEHIDACLFLIRERKVHRDYLTLGQLLKGCDATQSDHPSLKRQLADFYDGVGEHKKAFELYTDLELSLHALAIAYQEGWIRDLSPEQEALLVGEHLDTALHSVWLGISLQRPELIRAGLRKLEGHQEPLAWAALGAGHLALGDSQKALSALEGADGVAVSVLRGRAYWALGESDQAKQALEDALLLQPWNPWILSLLSKVAPSYQRMQQDKDPIEALVLGAFRDRYRPWPLLVPGDSMTTGEQVWSLDDIRPETIESCAQQRACWALLVEAPEGDERWSALSPVEKRFVQLVHQGTDLDVSDAEHDRDWYASGLHRLIVMKTDNLP